MLVHPDVALAVDAILQGQESQAEIRWLDEEGNVLKEQATATIEHPHGKVEPKKQKLHIYSSASTGPSSSRQHMKKGSTSISRTTSGSPISLSRPRTTSAANRRKYGTLSCRGSLFTPSGATVAATAALSRHNLYRPKGRGDGLAMDEAMSAIRQVKDGKPESSSVRKTLRSGVCSTCWPNGMKCHREARARTARRVKIVNT